MDLLTWLIVGLLAGLLAPLPVSTPEIGSHLEL